MNRSKTILLVEDSQDDVFFMQRALKEASITNPFFVVGNGQEAMDYLSGTAKFSDRSKYPMPGLIFLDLKLPLKRGLEVLSWLREQESLCNVVVVVLTSSQEPNDLREAYRLGANSYLLKPGSTAQLVELMKVVKAYWFESNLFFTVEGP
ncbi:MAG TPA: response regulator [Candidatus Saccharimonadales bacterium]|nr:response regulator [Candidatus Saccharimonadales bacterium]